MIPRRLKRHFGRADVLGGLFGLLLLVGTDLFVARAQVDAGGSWDSIIFRSLTEYDPEAGSRVAASHAEMVLPGLWPGSKVDAVLVMASSVRKAQVVAVVANHQTAARADVGGHLRPVAFTARASGEGELRIRLVGPAGSVRLARIDIHQTGRSLSMWSLALYALFLLIAAVGGRLLRLPGRPALVAVCGAAVVLSTALAASRVVTAACLPWALSILVGALALLAGLTFWTRMDRTSAGIVAGALAVKLAIALHPAIDGIDLGFHAHQILRWGAGKLVSSHVAFEGGSIAIPYPPLLYAMLWPFGRTPQTAESSVRVAMGLLEGTAPLLVYAVVRRGGGGSRVASLASAIAASLPEGVLVLGKGIAANILGSWLSLAAVTAAVGGGSMILVAGLTALAFLSHPGAAASLAGLMLLFMGLRLSRDWAARSGVLRTAAATSLGAIVAWLVYYVHTVALTTTSLAALGSQAASVPARFFALRWVHLGKIGQNLILKFGATPPLLAIRCLDRSIPGGLKDLLHAWLLCGGALALLAVVTPLSLRFEYFVAPAVAVAAAIAGARFEEAYGSGLVWMAIGVALAIQLALAALMISGRLDPIGVIIPSPRWPWPLVGIAAD